MKPNSKRKSPKEKLIIDLELLKDKISELSDFAVEHSIFPNNPTRILDLSCECDDIIGEIETA
jgi:hypothetical protein